MHRTRVVGATLTAAALMLVTACGGSDDSEGTAAPASSLAIGLDVTIQSLNPVLTPQTTVVAYSYDPLIYRAHDGSYQPDLATDWGYVGDGNTEFQLTLRDGVTFQDGTALDAQAVKNSIEYFLATPNPNLQNVGAISSVDVVSDQVVSISYSAPFPNAVDAFSQFFGVGLIIGPDGLADPDSLETTTDGAGQYALDASQTTTDSVYTFTANEDYWNPDAIQYDTIQLKPLPDANARLSALRSGQIQDATQIPLGQVGSDAADGYQQLTGDTTWMVLQFLNTDGALANLDVRQALARGVDRQSIVDDFYKGYATVQDQFSPTGTVGYSADLDGQNSYDADAAKDLLASGGSADGLTLRVLTNEIADPGGLLGQALENQYAAIGVDVQLDVISGTFAQFGEALASGNYDAVLWNVFSSDMYTAATQTLVSGTALLNPSKTVDPQVASLLATAASASGDEFTAASEELNTYLTTNALGVPIATRTNVDVLSPNIDLPGTTYATPTAIPVGPDAAYAWSTTS